MRRLFVVLFCSLLMAFAAIPYPRASAQFSILPKLQDDFKETQRAKYPDGKQISDTKLCSRIFKKVVNQVCRFKDELNETVIIESEGAGGLAAETCKQKKSDVLTETYRYDQRQEAEIQKKIAERDHFTESYLACAILSGNVKLWMMPYYVRYMADFIMAIIGPVVIIIIIIGGYYYITGSIGGEGEGAAKGKKIILAGIAGMVLIFAAWTIVNVISAVLTG